MLAAVPLVCALLYAAGSHGLKGALGRGASPASVNAASNFFMAALALPLLGLLVVRPASPDFPGLAAAVGAGVLLFVGRLFTLHALRWGDLSVVAPLLASKTLFVAGLTLITGTGEITPRMGLAALLASMAVIFLQRGPATHARPRAAAILLAVAASVFYALSDVIVQACARPLGIGLFLPVMFCTLAALVPFTRPSPLPSTARKPALAGSFVVGLQTTAMVFAIGLSGQATLLNILYSTRSLWAVLIDGWHGSARGFLASRLAGAALLTAAVVLASWKE